MSYISLHNHTDYSNLRMLDSINKVSDLIDYAVELGLKGIAITEHETIASHIKALQHYKKLKKKNSDLDFKLILGNEIYMTVGNEDSIYNPLEDNVFFDDYKLFHFILLAKDEIGHEQIRRLSSEAFNQSYMQFIRKVPTHITLVEKIIGENPGHVIASTACLGGFLGQVILEMGANSEKAEVYKKILLRFLERCDSIFGKENFFLEMQPSDTIEQKYVNEQIMQLYHEYGYNPIVTTDSHYQKKEDRPIHKVYLNSRNAEREVDAFYASTYLMSELEVTEFCKYLSVSDMETAFNNTLKIGEMCEDYDLSKPFNLPYMAEEPMYVLPDEYQLTCEMPNLKKFQLSPHISDKNMAFYIESIIKERELYKYPDKIARLDLELGYTWVSSEAQDIRWSRYLLQIADYIKIFWNEGDTLVGVGRGSCVGFYLNYLLGIIQIDPTEEKAPTKPWRFLNPERASILDIDIDIQSNRKDTVIAALKKKYGRDRVVKVMTVGTEKSKSAIQTACRGLEIDNDIALYLSSMIGSERGMLYTLDEVFYGNEEKQLKPNKQFVDEMTNNYPQVWAVAQKIEGLVCRLGQHAGGVIITEEDFTKASATMITNSGDLVSQFELHDEEEVGHVKIDLLAIEALDKIRACLDLLLNYGYIEYRGNLKNTYESVIGVYNLERNDRKMWEMVWNNQIISLFQLDQNSGIQGIALTRPQSVEDLATLNSVMRLMAQEKYAEQPLVKYARFKNDITAWYAEMSAAGLTKAEQDILKGYLNYEYGICATQEDIMSMLQDPAIGGFSLSYADEVRKSIAKKNPAAFEKLTIEYFKATKEKGCSENLCKYVWNVLVNTQRGYGFNLSHTLAYSIIGLQEMNLAYKFPIIYWNTANLIVDSGATDNNLDLESLEEEIDDEDFDEEENIKNKSVDYGKISTAIGKIQSIGIRTDLPDINLSRFTFTPDEKNNRIVYGIKGITRVGDKIVSQIMEGRPFTSLEDFLNRVKVNKLQAINLIKSGAFDNLEGIPRNEIMDNYLLTVVDQKKDCNLRNMQMLINQNLIPESHQYYAKVFNFNKYLKKFKEDIYYVLDENTMRFYSENYNIDYLESYNGAPVIKQTTWDKIYKKEMDPMRDFLKANKQKMLLAMNGTLIDEIKKKYAQGNLAEWEMASVGFYNTTHELAHVDRQLYDIHNFSEEPEEPFVKTVWYPKQNGMAVPIFQTYRIVGTVIQKDKTKNIVTLLTPDGVVNIKVWAAQFTKYDKQISVVGADGKKKVIEKSWFSRGNKLMVTGFKRGDMFVPKIYSRDKYEHYFEKIEKINDDGTLETIVSREG